MSLMAAKDPPQLQHLSHHEAWVHIASCLEPEVLCRGRIIDLTCFGKGSVLKKWD